MTQRKTDFQKLDELREKDEELFELTIGLLLSIGHDNFTDDMVAELMGSVKEDIEIQTDSIEDIGDAIVKMVVLCVAAELHSVSLDTLLDYIAENGWRRHEKPGC